jgi:FixJ family two-component response regulator
MFPDIGSRLFHDEPTVFAVGCDPATCQTLKDSLRSADLRVECHASIEDFLAACDPTWPGCVFLDLQHAEGGQQEVFGQLAERWVYLPVILLAVRRDVAAAVRAVRGGAFDFVPRPWSQDQLADAAEEALRWEAAHHAEILDRVRVEKRLARLNQGERDVLQLVLHGMSNEEISSWLGLSVRGVETRRSNLKKKMRAKGLADLLRQVLPGLGIAGSRAHGRFHVHAAGGGR